MPYTSTIVITGASTGLGYETALSLAKSEPDTQIVICSRTGVEVAESINSITGQSNVTYLPLDLSTHSGTRAFVAEYEKKSFLPIRALVLNAGIQIIDKLTMTKDNLEVHFAVNHVNHSLLFFLLAPHLTSTAHIVVVSSSTHDEKFKRVKPFTFTDPEVAAHPVPGPKSDTWEEALNRYALSKLCNVLFAYSLNRHARSAGKQWTVLALDPGVMATKLYREYTGVTGWLFNWALSTRLMGYFIKDLFAPAFAAQTLVKLAVSDEFEGRNKSGKYYQVVDAKEVRSGEQSYDEKVQEDLWDWTIAEVAKDEIEATRFRSL